MPAENSKMQDQPLDLSNLQFLKLGGSLITEKSQPETPRLDVLQRLAQEIAQARRENPRLALVFGHGSGSFGHVPALFYGTRRGVQTPEEWQGFVEVWRTAQALNRLVLDSLAAAGLPALAISPFASVIAKDGKVSEWNLTPLRRALQSGLLPVVYGDVVFDEMRGGTILSTDDLFAHLAGFLSPRRILLAGIEPGVWADYPACTHLVEQISRENYQQATRSLAGSAVTDVTGGMASKVQHSLELATSIPGLEVLIFSGETPGTLLQVLLGGRAGTCICA